MNVEIKIKFNVAIEKDNQGYVARILSLGLYGVGDTKAQATKSLKTSIDITIEHCLADGTLNDVLKEAVFEKRIRTSKSKKVIPLDYSFPINYEQKQRLYA